MSISISKIFKDLCTEKYNKINILTCAFLLLALFGIYYIPFLIPKPNPLLFLTSIICLCLYTIFISGYIALTSHNEALSKEQVVPSLKEWVSLLKNGFFFSLGQMILSMIMSSILSVVLLIVGVFAAFLIPILMQTGSNPYLAVTLLSLTLLSIAAASIILFYVFIAPNMLNFLATLKFENFFDFSKGKNLINSRKELYKQYAIKHFLISLIIILIPIIETACLVIYLGPTPQKLTVEQNLIFSLIIGLTSIASVLLGIIVYPNLNGQIIKIAPIPETEEKVEYVEEYEEEE